MKDDDIRRDSAVFGADFKDKVEDNGSTDIGSDGRGHGGSGIEKEEEEGEDEEEEKEKMIDGM